MSSNDRYHLTVRFAGICTHFRYGIALGVPHRVVLPDASKVIVGRLTIADTPIINPTPATYQLLPHFPQLEVPGADNSGLYVPPLVEAGGETMRDGDVLSAVRMQVINAVDTECNYLDNAVTPRVTEFVPHFTFSGDVVLNGRAACYFDIFGGTLQAMTNPKGATQTTLRLTTDGPPELLVTALASSDPTPRSFRLPLPLTGGSREVTLFVKNLEEMAPDGDPQAGAFDFLLHCLTARGGIPQVIRKRMPGMPTNVLAATSGNDLEATSNSLAALVRSRDAGSGRHVLPDPDDVTPSCSDSQYP